jgi:hypothetical protein
MRGKTMRSALRHLLLALPLFLAMGTAASAASNHVVHGLFCKTRANLDEAIAYIQENVSAPEAVLLTNREEVVCVYADRIGFMLEDASALGKAQRDGTALYLYEGAAVGILVGDNPRPLTPPVHMYFAVPRQLPGVALAGDA